MVPTLTLPLAILSSGATALQYGLGTIRDRRGVSVPSPVFPIQWSG
jgi:hypothetical protein